MSLHRFKALLHFSILLLPYSFIVSLILVFMKTGGNLLMVSSLPRGRILESQLLPALGDFSTLLPTLGLAGGFFLHRIFHRGEEIFWWNLGLPLSLRLVGTFCVFGFITLGLQGLLWQF